MRPPEYALKFLRWFCREDYLEEIEGDLTEVFEKQYGQSPTRARRKFAWSVLRYFRPRFIKSFKPHYANAPAMTRHNLLITLRSFKRYKTSFIINLVGLSTGLACALIIYLWVNDELTVDHHHEKDARLYQVMQNLKDVSGIKTGDGTAGILAKALADEIPGIEYATSVVPAQWFSNAGTVTVGDRRIKAKGQYVDQDYFHVFSCTFLEGDKKKALTDKYGVAISEELAQKLFNTTQATGKTLEWKMEMTTAQFHVTGVFKSPPANATSQFDLLVNYELFLDAHPWLREWGNSDPNTFVVVREGADINALNQRLAGFLQSKDKDSRQYLFLQKYSDRYLHGTYENGVIVGGRIEYVRLFSIIAVFLLSIACINFMNLSTARASRRMKEVGIKKTVGATRSSLVMQYFGESLLVTFLSLAVAVFMVMLFLPQFNSITGKTLVLTWDNNLLLTVLTIALITGIVSGSYPALYLSNFRPAIVLKGKLPDSFGELMARKGLVVFQFVISVVLIVAVLVVYKQVAYVQSRNLGYDRSHIVHFDMEISPTTDENFFAVDGAFEKSVETFLNEVKNVPGVESATNAGHDLTGRHGGLGGINWQDGDEDEKMMFSNFEVGYDFIPTLGIEMAAGRNFSREFSQERARVIFNQEAIDRMGLKDPIGKTIRLWGQEKQIIGVTKNFHFESLYREVGPCVIQLEPRAFTIIAKIKGGEEHETIDRLSQLYRQQSAGLTFDYRFLDDDYQALYTAELRVSQLSRYFAGIAILISCLGLFGLAAFTAERKTKEIGIRKILGAGNTRIMYLLSSEFIKMVIIAIGIALPASYIGARSWLHSFAYHVELDIWLFVVAGVLAVAIALLTIGVQTIKAARISPVQSLKEQQ